MNHVSITIRMLRGVSYNAQIHKYGEAPDVCISLHYCKAVLRFMFDKINKLGTCVHVSTFPVVTD